MLEGDKEDECERKGDLGLGRGKEFSSKVGGEAGGNSGEEEEEKE